MHIKNFSPELLEAVKNKNKYMAERMLESEALAKEVKKETRYEVICEHYFDEDYYQYSKVIVPFPHYQIEVKKNYKDKYEISCPTLYKLIDNNNFSFYQLSRIEEQFKKPNNIGKLTEKKLHDWETYYRHVYYKAVDKLEEIKTRVQSFKNEIIDTGLYVNWSNETSGEIIKNGIKFKFNLIEGHPILNIEIHYKVPNTLQSFLKLSDNNYQ